MPPVRTGKNKAAPVSGPLGRFGVTVGAKPVPSAAPSSASQPSASNSVTVNSSEAQISSVASTPATQVPQTSSASHPPVVQPLATPSQPSSIKAQTPPTKTVTKDLGSVKKGLETASFPSTSEWSQHRERIGTSTRAIHFGGGFVLTDNEHLDDILSIGSQVCQGVQSFVFEFEDSSYSATNDEKGVTDPTLAAFAQACPNLTKFQLQGTAFLPNHTLIAFLKHCPLLEFVEITNHSRSQRMGLTSNVFDALLEDPNLAPNLTTLVIPDIRDGDCTGREKAKVKKSLKALSKARASQPTLIIKLVDVDEEKEYGDWEITRREVIVKKGVIKLAGAGDLHSGEPRWWR